MSSEALIPKSKATYEKLDGFPSDRSNGLTASDVYEFIEDPVWVKIRQILLCLTVLSLVTVLVISVLIIVTTPACKTVRPKYINTNAWRTRECKSDEECAAIQNTSCMSDPRDYKMRCLCRDSSAPINGACPNRPRAVGSPCKIDSECVDGSECKSMNITISSFKTCQCKEGYMSRDGYCSGAFNVRVPSLFTVLGVIVAHIVAHKLRTIFY